MNFSIFIIFVAQIGNISADNIGWNRLSNNVNQLRQANTNQANDYNGQMLRHLIKEDEKTFQKFLNFLRNQNRLSSNDRETHFRDYHKNK